MSPDIHSTHFPHRPIRPLPRRRLRERLSPDVADSIQYPPAPASNTPILLYHPYGAQDDEPEKNLPIIREREPPSFSGGRAPRPCGMESEDDGGDGGAAKMAGSWPSPTALDRLARPQKPGFPGARHAVSQAPPSTASSTDGYDSLENNNNKKKRKIPAAGDVSLNGGHALNDLGSGAAPLASPAAANDPQSEASSAASPTFYAANSFLAGSPGISGPGRGRFGRVKNGRSPLQALSDAASYWAVGRNGKPRPSQWSSQLSSTLNKNHCCPPRHACMASCIFFFSSQACL